MHGAVVEFHALADADRTAAQHDDLLLVRDPHLVLLGVGGVIVRRCRFKLGGAGIHHLIGGDDAGGLTLLPDFLPGLAGQGRDGHIGKAALFSQPQQSCVQRSLLNFLFQLHNLDDLYQEPFVNHGLLMDLIYGAALAEIFSDGEEPFIILFADDGQQFLQV